ncbi:MAG: anti-sigma factor [Acidobacteria bacterium]|nr:anti-sigma factor [Acidobacteriota bacterium]
MKGHADYKDALALAALDSADEAELRALDAHLASCGECRAELRALRDTAAALALAAPPLAPPPELRARLLAALKATPREGARKPGETEREAVAGRAAASAHDAGRGSNVVSFEEARRGSRRVIFSRPAFVFGAIAAALVVCALAAATVALWRSNSAMKSQLASVSVALTETRDELGEMRGELARARQERELLSAPDARTADLVGTKAAQSARARLTYDARTGEAMLVATDLPPAPAGRAYQLWFIADGKPLPGSVFTTDARGRAETHGTIPPEGRRAQGFAVTLEPAGGAQSPTGEMYLRGTT